MSPSIQRCAFHESRPAFARCMSCAKMLCQECATQWDGIWHCSRCLAAKRGATIERTSIGGWISLVVAAAVLQQRLLKPIGALVSAAKRF